MRETPLSDEERLNWLRLSKSENVGPSTFKTLLNRYHSATEALRALPELTRKGGLGRPPRIYARERAEQDFQNAARIGARFIAIVDPEYPPLLRETDTVPPIICARGALAVLGRSGVAVVGARNASAIARKFSRQLAREIGGEGHVIVSGLARGIDTAAHEAALDTGTIAVVAGGVDVIYPPENEALHAAIAERGVIVSEQMPGTEPKADYFPRRNRIISGIARALIVVEAAVRSGSLITARFAAEQGREVYAVPGSPLDPRCEGTNRLIRDGATLLTSARDVIDVLTNEPRPRQMSFLEPDPPPLIPRETDEADARRLLELLSPTPIDIDDLLRESGLDASVLSALLMELALAGAITRHPNGAVSRA
jgi:DNA processing protein